MNAYPIKQKKIKRKKVKRQIRSDRKCRFQKTYRKLNHLLTHI